MIATKETTRIRVPEDKTSVLHDYLRDNDFPTGSFGMKKRRGTIPTLYSGKREGLFGEGEMITTLGYEYGFSITTIPEKATSDIPGTYIVFEGKPTHEVSKLIKALDLELE